MVMSGTGNNEIVPARVIPLKTDPVLNERWLQERIAEDPSLLGLGELVVKDLERRQPRAGRRPIGSGASGRI